MSLEFNLVRRKVLGALGAMGAATVGGVTLASETSAQGRQPPEKNRFVYSVKFICGSIETAEAPRDSFDVEPPAKPANYATAINVHNLGNENVEFTIQATVSGIEPVDTPDNPISDEETRELEANQSLEIDCPEIADLFDPTVQGSRFVTGFVRIESPALLEVVGVYTNERTIRLSTTPPKNGDDGGDGDDGVVEQDQGTLMRTAATGTSVDVEYIEPYRLRGQGNGRPKDNPNGNGR